MSGLQEYIAKVADGAALDAGDAESAFDIIMSGAATPSQIGGFLMALRVRGEAVTEIAGAVKSMRQRMLPVSAPDNAIDIVGTGGDKSGTYNVSTCATFIAAGCGIPIAKHGNRALSSLAGASDALSALGIKTELTPEQISHCIEKAGVGFMFAPMHHSAMRHVGPTRVELATRTIFNILGPLSNPAGVKRQLLGVFSADYLQPIAEALRERGSEKVWVVHGNGLDEMTTTGPTRIIELNHGEIRSFEITPEDVGLQRVELAQLKGGDGQHNAKALRAVLEGEKNAYRDIALLNAAGAVVVSGKADDLNDALAMATEALDSGKALEALEQLISVSNSYADDGDE